MVPGRDITPIALALVAAAACLQSCSSGVKPALDSPVASARIEAMPDAARRKDPQEIRELIAQLDSGDAAVRVFAIATLEKITGERRGYDPADPERLRLEATDRWQAWYGQEYGARGVDGPGGTGGGAGAGVADGAGTNRWKDSKQHSRQSGGDGAAQSAGPQGLGGSGPARPQSTGHTP